MLCLICARDDAFVLDAAKTKTDNTNPKLHPYMFRVFVYDFGKTPFFFLFRLMSIPSLFLSLSLSKINALFLVFPQHTVCTRVRPKERERYIHTHICFSLPFFFTFSLFVRVCAVYLRFDSIHRERDV